MTTVLDLSATLTAPPADADSGVLASIPVHIILEDKTALFGAARVAANPNACDSGNPQANGSLLQTGLLQS